MRVKVAFIAAFTSAACAVAIEAKAAPGKGGFTHASQGIGHSLSNVPSPQAVSPAYVQPGFYPPPNTSFPTPTPRRRKDLHSPLLGPVAPTSAQTSRSSQPAAPVKPNTRTTREERPGPAAKASSAKSAAKASSKNTPPALTSARKETDKRAATKRNEAKPSAGSAADSEARPNAASRPKPNSAPVVVAPPVPAPVAAPAFPSIGGPQSGSNAPIVAQPVNPRDLEQNLSNLSADERAKLSSAHQTALHDPALAASRERYLQERRAYREQLRAALLRVDPSVQPILDKVKRHPGDH